MSQAPPSVSVLGLGAMGGVLAQTLLQSGCAVTVWNRSAERAATLVDAGATHAQDPASALQASDLIVVYMIDKTASVAVLLSLGPTLDQGGKTIANMSTGTVADVGR